jgi:flavodoxin
MNILLLYATYSGGTEVAAGEVETKLASKGHAVTKKNPKETSAEEINAADLTLLCTPTWDFEGKEGMPHEDFNTFIETHKGTQFGGKKFAILGLGDSSYTKFTGSVDILEEFVKTVGGMLAQPSLRIDGFFFDQTKHTEEVQKWADTLG